MRIYNLDVIIRDAIGVPPVANIHFDRIDEPTYYKNNIGYNKFLEDKKPIYLELIKWEGRGAPLKQRDYHYLGAGRPSAYLVVCSPKFRSVLETLNLPLHRFYDCELSVKNQILNYFVFHFIQDWTKDIDYSKSVFDVVAYMEDFKMVKRLNVGEVKNFENYEVIQEMLGEIQQTLKPARLYFQSDIKYVFGDYMGKL